MDAAVALKFEPYIVTVDPTTPLNGDIELITGVVSVFELFPLLLSSLRQDKKRIDTAITG